MVCLISTFVDPVSVKVGLVRKCFVYLSFNFGRNRPASSEVAKWLLNVGSGSLAIVFKQAVRREPSDRAQEALHGWGHKFHSCSGSAEIEQVPWAPQGAFLFEVVSLSRLSTWQSDRPLSCAPCVTGRHSSALYLGTPLP